MTDFSTRPRRKDRTTAVLIVAAGVGVLAVAAAGAVRARTDVVAGRAALVEAARSLEEMKARARALEGSRVGSDEERLAALVVVGRQAPPAAVLAAIERAMPADVRLDSLVFDYEGGLQLQMEVQARHPAAYDEFLARLAASPQFQDVAPGAEVRDDALRASVKARYRGGR